MKKRLLLGVLAIALIAGLVGAFTYAWFSDVQTTTGTFHAGTVDLEFGPDTVLPIVVEDLKPCIPQYWIIKLVLDESNEGPVYFHIGDLVGYPGVTNDAELAADPDNTVHDIHNWITFDLYIDVNKNGEIDDADDVIIHPDDHMKLGDLVSVWIYLDWLDGSGMDLILSFHLQDETGNEYQGDYATGDLHFRLQQEDAPPPGNRILLENKDEASGWEPILGDGIWGIGEYDEGSLDLSVVAHGLPTDGRALQVGMTSPEVADWYPVHATTRVAMASALASGVYDGTSTGTAPPAGFNLYERGYNAPGATVLHTTYADGDQGTYIVATALGVSSSAAQADSNGHLNWSDSATLPSGTYSYIKLLVKDDALPYATHLMEKDTPMFFVIP